MNDSLQIEAKMWQGRREVPTNLRAARPRRSPHDIDDFWHLTYPIVVAFSIRLRMCGRTLSGIILRLLGSKDARWGRRSVPQMPRGEPSVSNLHTATPSLRVEVFMDYRGDKSWILIWTHRSSSGLVPAGQSRKTGSQLCLRARRAPRGGPASPDAD